MEKTYVKRFFFIALCLSMAFLMIVFSVPLIASAVEGVDEDSEEVSEEGSSDEDYKNQLADLQSQSTDLEKKKKELENKINNVKDQKKKQNAIISSIDEKIDLLNQEIALCEEKIDLSKKYINNKEKEIAHKTSDIEDSMQLFRERVRALYMTGGGYSDKANSVAMLLSSSSVSEFLTRNEFLKRINEHDSELVHELQDELQALNEQKAVLEEEKKVLEQEQAELDTKVEELDAERAVAKSSVQDLAAMQKEFEENYEEVAALSKAIQEEIANVYKNLKTSSEAYVGGEMLWPVPGYYTISSYYGWRFDHTDFHTGNDITGGGIHGAPVVAANTGTVIFTKYCPYNGKSYGYGTYIIIDHGGGITTLYGHLSAITVEVGDVVAMGEQIGNVGNTGWSTGAHLHFEVRIDGNSVDSLPYIT